MTVAGESLLSLYKKSHTVQLLSWFYNLVGQYGIRGKELEWFDGYLSGRRQRVCISLVRARDLETRLGLHRRGKEQVD